MKKHSTVDNIISQFSSKQKIVINMYWEINSSFKENKKRKVMGKELFPYLKKIKKGKLWEKSYSHSFNHRLET